MTDQPDGVEQIYRYPSRLLTRYLGGTLFREWCDTYSGSLLFCKRMHESRQIPHSGPIDHPMFFNELYLGTQYLDAGYEVLFFYRQVEDEQCYQKACEILGGADAEQFITPNNERGGRAPDLLVYDPESLRFRFVECKGEREAYTANQPGRFLEIEEYLNATLPAGSEALSDSSHMLLFPRLWPGQWIHVARLSPRR